MTGGGLIEQLGTLRAVGVNGDEKQLQLLLRAAGYNVERAINHYFESGLPGPPPSPRQESPDAVASPPPARAVTETPVSRLPPAPRDAAERAVARGRGAGGPLATRGPVASSGSRWPKLVGERWVTGYSTRRGSLKFREKIDIISEGSGKSRSSPLAKGKGGGGRGGSQAKLWSGGAGAAGGGRFGRPKVSSAGSMSHILFRGSGGIEGRLPREVCTFLAPLLQKGLVVARAEAVCDMPGLGVFADVPLMLSIEIEEGLFALDPDDDVYRSAYCLLQFAHTGHIEQEQQQPKTQKTSAGNGASSGKSDGASANHRKEEAGSAAEAAAATTAGSEEKKGAESEKAEQGEEEEEEKEVREEDVKELYDDEAQASEMPEAHDPKLFIDGLTLRRYQRQALAWMIDREKKRYVTEESCTGLSVGGGGRRGVP